MDIVEKVESEVAGCIDKYGLLKKSDKVVVAMSGGKDSTSIAYILKKMGYDVYGLMIDLYMGDWSEAHKENMIKFCKENDIPLTMVDTREEFGHGMGFFKGVLKVQKNLNGCTVCGIIKRWVLNKWAKKMGADRIVTGHNLDDEAQNVVMNFLKGNLMLGANSGPSAGLGEVKDFAQRVKPFFFTAEDDIRKYSEAMKFDILYDRCPCSFRTYRADARDFLWKINDDEKLKMVKGFQEVAKDLRGKNTREMKVCEKCGEPSSNNICKACEIFDVL